MQVEKAPLESYADVGGLEQQVIEIKEAVELPLTHPELYQDIGIKPPKVRHWNLLLSHACAYSSKTHCKCLSDWAMSQSICVTADAGVYVHA